MLFILVPRYAHSFWNQVLLILFYCFYMARVTVEDCLEKIENRFKLVLLASKRARQLNQGADTFVSRDKDKETVIALREIAAGHVAEENIDLLHAVGERDLSLPPTEN